MGFLKVMFKSAIHFKEVTNLWETIDIMYEKIKSATEKHFQQSGVIGFYERSYNYEKNPVLYLESNLNKSIEERKLDSCNYYSDTFKDKYYFSGNVNDRNELLCNCLELIQKIQRFRKASGVIDKCIHHNDTFVNMRSGYSSHFEYDELPMFTKEQCFARALICYFKEN